MKMTQACVAVGSLLGMFGPGARASELQSVSPITERVLRLHFVEGKAFHETLGGNGSDGRVEVSPLDLAKAALPDSYQIDSRQDTRFARPLAPVRVGRKSKGQDFVNTAQGTRWVMAHDIYLILPDALARGKAYSVRVGDLSSAKRQVAFTFDERTTRSETIHVNQIGYVPGAVRLSFALDRRPRPTNSRRIRRPRLSPARRPDRQGGVFGSPDAAQVAHRTRQRPAQ
jgi:hypothetical protein